MKRVIVVGAGVIGLMCAVRLRVAGAQVTLLEAEREHPSVYGPIASAAAAGMLAPLEAGPSPHERLALESFDLWRAWQNGAEWADGVRLDGGVVVLGAAEEAAAFQRNAERLGRSATLLQPKQFSKRTGLQSRLEHAVYVGDEGVADPLRVLTGLAMQARAMGTIIEFETDVASATATTVLTHEGRVYDADAVVLAPGAWGTDKLMNAAPALKHVRPAKGHVVSVALEQPLAPTLRANDFYLVQRREDVVLGATMEMDRYDRAVDAARVGELMAAAEAVLPGEVKPVGKAWAGIRPMSPDGWPMIGPSGEGLYVAAGHSRNGWLLAPITAEIISAYVFGRDIEPAWAALSPDRFGSP
jgi:glycine oxidase